jgi:hypothetical protein
MKKQKLIDLPYVIGLLLLPFLIMGLILLAGFLDGLARYDPALFSEQYLEKYANPNSLITDLETALHTGNTSLLRELQGTRGEPAEFAANPNLRFMIFTDFDGVYSDYLFMDTTNYHRYIQHLKEVGGRYVKVPDGLYYFVNSRDWVSTFGPIMVIWWAIVLLFTIGVWLYRLMARYRQQRFGEVPRKPS